VSGAGLTLVQLSDTHIGPPGEKPFGTDTAANLRAVVARVRAMRLQPACFIVSGDLSSDGSPASYRHFQAIVDAELAPFGVPVLLMLGNHDDRVAFRQVLLGEAPASVSQRYYYTASVGDLRVHLLDSHVPGEEWGELGLEQLAWLDQELSVPSAAGHVVVVHHPSVPRGLPSPDDSLLQDSDAFEDVLTRHHDVAGVLCGHAHLSGFAAFAGTLHVVAPATAYLLDPSVQDGSRGYEGSGFNLCVVKSGRLTAHPVFLPGPQGELFRH
jgi:3',5'-cyclic AMP phosphodiesterase CpdA